MKKNIWPFSSPANSGDPTSSLPSSSYTLIKKHCSSEWSMAPYSVATVGFHQATGPVIQSCLQKGSNNSAADSLSRRLHPTDTCATVSVVTPNWCSETIVGYQNDPRAQKILLQLAVDNSSVPHFSLDNGLLRYKQCIWVGSNVIF